MSARIITRATQAHCYKCGSTKVVQVCHHCGAAICDTDARTPSELQAWLLRPEYGGLSLPVTLHRHFPAHCDNCAHLGGIPSWPALVVSAALALLGGLLAWQRMSPAALVLILLGLGVVVAAAVLDWRWRSVGKRPPLPLFPRVGIVKVRETVAAKVVLGDDSKYQIDQQPTIGELELIATLQRSERERLDQYRRLYRLAGDSAVSYHAGFLVLHEKAALRFRGAASAAVTAPNVLALTGETSSVPFLSGASTRESDLFTYKCSYEVCEPLKPMPLPLTLVPSFVQESGQQSLDLELQWIEPRQWNDNPLEIDRISLLRIDVPALWGEVEGVDGGPALISIPEPGVRRIEWQQQLATSDMVKECSRRFSLRFDSEIDQNDTIRGRAEVQFRDALSALKDVKLFYPLGTPRKTDSSRISTTVEVDFELSLKGVRYQATRLVPDLKRQQDDDRPALMTYEGVVPDYATVIKLTNALSRRPLYIKRTIENPPRIGEHVSLRNRYWDIAGRSYDSVYPIDVHIILSGEEVYGGSPEVQGGTTHVSLTVQGAFVNQEMEAKIVRLWDELHAQIDSIMRSRPRIRSAAQASYEDEIARAGALDVAGVNLMRERLTRLLQTMRDEQVSTVKVYQELMLLAQDLDQVASPPEDLHQTEVGG